jgi:hypothetical protein
VPKVEAEFTDEPVTGRSIPDWLRIMEPGQTILFRQPVRIASIREAARRLGTGSHQREPFKYSTQKMEDGSIKVTRKQ